MPPKKEPPSRDVDVDGVICHVTKYPNRTYVNIGSTSNRATFNLKNAEWTDDEAVRVQARSHRKFAGIAAAQAASSSLPAFEHVEAHAGLALRSDAPMSLQ